MIFASSKEMSFGDKTFKYLALLKGHFGNFSEIENPKTRTFWIARKFIRLILPILIEEMDFLLFFEKVIDGKLHFSEDAKQFFLEAVEKQKIDLTKSSQMDQVDLYYEMLQNSFGEFSVVENPCTRISWPAVTFIRRIIPVLSENEDQLELLFSGVINYKLFFRDDAREIVVETVTNMKIQIDRFRPQHV